MKQKQTQKQTQRQREVKGSDLFLPEEIITNILKRLPVKSLIRFKSVCIHWKNLTKTQSFIHEHLNRASNQNPCLLFGDLSSPNTWKLYLLNNELKVAEVNCASLFDLLRHSEIIGSSNGLLCLKHNKYLSHPILLWNPAIRQVRLVARPTNYFAGDFLKLRFGFSSVVNDYKILAIYNIRNVEDYKGQVYSLKTRSWKEVESSPLKGVAVKPGSFAANGSIFWFGLKRNMEDWDDILVSFDMAVEVFTLIPSPISLFTVVYSLSTCLTIHENKLAIVSHTSISNSVFSMIDLWVMEDGTGKSGERWGWTKKVSIRHPFLLVAGTIWGNKIVCLPRRVGATEGEMLDAEWKSIALVDLTTSEVKMFTICKYGRPYPLLNYVESLVPVIKDHKS